MSGNLEKRLQSLERRYGTPSVDAVAERVLEITARELGITPDELRAEIAREAAQYPTVDAHIAAIAAETGLTVADFAAEAEAYRAVARYELAAERAGP